MVPIRRVLAAVAVTYAVLSAGERVTRPGYELRAWWYGDADARTCVPGRVGCRCAADDRCAGTCRRGLCFGARYPVPDAYLYRDDAQHDVERIHALVLAALDLTPGLRVADLGAGPGWLTVPIAQRLGPDGRVWATDLDDHALARLRAHLDDARTRRPLAPVEIRRVTAPRDTGLDDLAPASLDRVLMINVFGFGPDRPRAETVSFLARVCRLVRPGGRVLYHQDWLRRPEGEYPVDAMRAIFRDAGCGRTRERPMPALMPPWSWALPDGIAAPAHPMERGYLLEVTR